MKPIEKNSKVTFHAENKPKVDRMLMKSGTIIKYNALPFRLERDTWVLGNKSNMKLAREEAL